MLRERSTRHLTTRSPLKPAPAGWPQFPQRVLRCCSAATTRPSHAATARFPPRTTYHRLSQCWAPSPSTRGTLRRPVHDTPNKARRCCARSRSIRDRRASRYSRCRSLEEARGIVVIRVCSAGGILIGGRRGPRRDLDPLAERRVWEQFRRSSHSRAASPSAAQFGAGKSASFLVFANERSIRNIQAGPKFTLGGERERESADLWADALGARRGPAIADSTPTSIGRGLFRRRDRSKAYGLDIDETGPNDFLRGGGRESRSRASVGPPPAARCVPRCIAVDRGARGPRRRPTHGRNDFRPPPSTRLMTFPLDPAPRSERASSSAVRRRRGRTAKTSFGLERGLARFRTFASTEARSRPFELGRYGQCTS